MIDATIPASPMTVLVTGATGLIGSAVVTRLNADGHRVVGVTRRIDAAARRVHASAWVELDLRDVHDPDDWTAHLSGIDAVVNCAGALQDGPRDSVEATHARAPTMLWKACARLGIRRAIQISAAGVDRDPDTEFMRTKMIADAELAGSGLDATILRPTLVLGRTAYGGSALFRALAALPVAIVVPGAGRFDHVSVDDVAETVAWALASRDAVGQVLEMAGDRSLSYEETIAAYRQWLGLRPAIRMRMPTVLMVLAFRIGDAASMFGWRTPIRTTAWRETMRGSHGDGRRWTSLTGIVPDRLPKMLSRDPASVQEKWFARLYLLKGLGIVCFSLFWLATALLTLGPAWDAGVDVMRNAGVPAPEIATGLGSATDALVGGLIAFRATARNGLRASLALTLFYAATATALQPHLWIDPLGPLVKLFPVMLANLMLLAVMDER